MPLSDDRLIYIADDEPANLSLLEAILGRAGFTSLTTFPDGRSLMTAVAEREPDLILLDLRMPVLDGLTLLRELRDHGDPDRYLPVLVLTADATRSSRDEALSSGAHDYLTKPFDPAEVLLRVRNLLETRRLHQQLRQRNDDLVGEVRSTTQSLADREHEWAAHATALSRLEARDTPEATADAVCDELGRIPGLTSAVVVSLDAAGHIVPLARVPSVDSRIRVNTPIPASLTEGWADRLRTGPWVGPSQIGFGASLGPLSNEPQTAIALLPLRTSSALLGAIVVSTASVDGVTFLAGRLPILESFAAVASALLAPGIVARQQRGEIRGELQAIVDARAFRPVFQPIVDLETGAIVGHEALTRFDDGTRPDQRFADADAAGLGLDLEAACLEAAIDASTVLPARTWLSLNVSPAVLLERTRLRDCLRLTARPIVLEITEHVAIEDYLAFRGAALALGREVRIAVDDAGAGFASFRHILELRPDFVKLDIGLVRQIDRDHVRQALVAGIVYFARMSRCELIAEGVETEAERSQLRQLGVHLGQGFLLGRPAAATSLASTTPSAGSPSPSVTGGSRSGPPPAPVVR
jgi:EAL domain-containing protein (putative c-di-GMP-specific phosphodiesterase class I)/DNA-binding response OmpR family regulator